MNKKINYTFTIQNEIEMCNLLKEYMEAVTNFRLQNNDFTVKELNSLTVKVNQFIQETESTISIPQPISVLIDELEIYHGSKGKTISEQL